MAAASWVSSPMLPLSSLGWPDGAKMWVLNSPPWGSCPTLGPRLAVPRHAARRQDPPTHPPGATTQSQDEQTTLVVRKYEVRVMGAFARTSRTPPLHILRFKAVVRPFTQSGGSNSPSPIYYSFQGQPKLREVVIGGMTRRGGRGSFRSSPPRT